MFQTEVLDKIKTHILCLVTFFFEKRAVYDTMFKNLVDLEKPGMTIWRMLISRWVPKATNTHTPNIR